MGRILWQQGLHVLSLPSVDFVGCRDVSSLSVSRAIFVSFLCAFLGVISNRLSRCSSIPVLPPFVKHFHLDQKFRCCIDCIPGLPRLSPRSIFRYKSCWHSKHRGPPSTYVRPQPRDDSGFGASGGIFDGTGNFDNISNIENVSHVRATSLAEVTWKSIDYMPDRGFGGKRGSNVKTISTVSIAEDDASEISKDKEAMVINVRSSITIEKEESGVLDFLEIT